MQTIKNWFGIETAYRFEWNDVRCGITILNVILIMLFGLQVSWFGLAIALFGVCKDLSQHRHINDVMMHLSSVVLNVYFLSLLYKQTSVYSSAGAQNVNKIVTISLLTFSYNML